MKKIYYFISAILFAGCLSFGCSDSAVGHSEAEIVDYINLTPQSQIKLGELIDSSKYILLETTDRSLITNIERVDRDRDLIFVQDRNDNLYVFDSEGQFLNSIGYKGRGPGEFVYLYTFFLDRNNNEVAIFDTYQRKVLFYDYRGTMIRETTLPESILYYIDRAVIAPDGNILLGNKTIGRHVSRQDEIRHQYDLLRYDRDLDSLTVVGGLLDRLVPNVDFPMSYGKSISSSPDRLLLTASYSNIIYEYTTNGLREAYAVKTSKTIPNQKYFEEQNCGPNDFFTVMTRDNIFQGINSVGEDESFLLINFGNSGVLYDKRSKKGAYLGFLKDVGDSYISLGTVNRWGESWMTVERPTALMSRYEATKDTGDSALRNVVRNLDENDNPVLRIFTFRDDAVERLYKEYGPE